MSTRKSMIIYKKRHEVATQHITVDDEAILFPDSDAPLETIFITALGKAAKNSVR